MVRQGTPLALPPNTDPETFERYISHIREIVGNNVTVIDSIEQPQTARI